jgi:hypothetical protein
MTNALVQYLLYYHRNYVLNKFLTRYVQETPKHSFKYITIGFSFYRGIY